MYKKSLLFSLFFCVAQIQCMFLKRFLHKNVSKNYVNFKKAKRFLNHKENPVDTMLEEDQAELCGYTPLHLVFVSNHYQSIEQRKKVAEMLLKKGANPNIQDIFGNTSLHWAMRFDNPDLITFLIEHGADTNIKNFRGEKPNDIPLRNLYYDDLLAD